MEKGKSKIQVIDTQSEQVLFECELNESEKAFAFAASMEELGLDVKVKSPTLSQTLSNSLGLSDAQVRDFEKSIEQEIEEHDGSCCFKDQDKKNIH